MRWVAQVLAAAFVLVAGSAGMAQPTRPRLALVIGNADYDQDGHTDASPQARDRSIANGFAPDLRNALNDAGDMRDALQRIGYEVTYLENTDIATLRAAFTTFNLKVARAASNRQVVVYFAGHGVNTHAIPYVIPVGARPPPSMPDEAPSLLAPRRRTQDAMATFTVPLTDMLTGLGAPTGRGFTLVLLDNCRDNPWFSLTPNMNFTRLLEGFVGQGVMPIDNMPRATLIGFAANGGEAAEDGDGRNGPYATALLRVLDRRDLSVSQMMNIVAADVAVATDGRQKPQTYPFERKVNGRCVPGCGRR